MSLIYHTSIQETLNHGPFGGHIISFDLLPKVCAPTSSIQIVISLAQQVIINHSTSPSPSTFPPSSTFHCIFMYHMYTIPPQIDPVRMLHSLSCPCIYLNITSMSTCIVPFNDRRLLDSISHCLHYS